MNNLGQLQNQDALKSRINSTQAAVNAMSAVRGGPPGLKKDHIVDKNMIKRKKDSERAGHTTNHGRTG